MVGAGRQTRSGKVLGDPQRGPLQGHVHDRRSGRTLAQSLDQRRVAFAGCDRCRQQRQVGSVEAGDDGVRFGDPEAGADVGDDGRGRGGGQCQHAFGGELAGALGELEVVGPEVVAPLRDAVRLVDGEQRDPRACELGEEALVVEALRCDVEELERAGAEPVEDLALLGGVEARVEPRRVDPASLEEVDLILHQRDQRGHDDRHPVEQQRRQLVAEALARAGREDGEGGPAGEKRLDDLLLSGTEGVEAESRGEHFERMLCGCGAVGHAGRLIGGRRR